MTTIRESLGGGVVGVGDVGKVVIMIQRALMASGAELVVDGEFGAITKAAVKRFQASNGLTVDGYVGPETADALDRLGNVQPVTSVLAAAPWLSQMRAITGVKEVLGTSDSPIIMSWRGDIARAFPETASYLTTYKHDSVPWCGLTLAACMARSGIRPPFGGKDTDRFLWAASWADWGVPLKSPVVGCVMVFTRTGGGHVTILEKLDGDIAYVRGGNQSDMVNVMKKNMSSFSAAVWPSNLPVRQDIAGIITNAVPEGGLA